MKPPISDPFEPARSEITKPYVSSGEMRTFSFSIGRAFLASLPFVVLTFLIAYSATTRVRPDYRVVVLTWIPCFYLALCLLPVFLSQIQITQTHLKAPNFWGFGREVELSQIRKVKYFWLVWPYLVISTNQKRNTIWLPLFFLRDAKGFARAVEEWAPEGNPLREWLKANQP